MRKRSGRGSSNAGGWVALAALVVVAGVLIAGGVVNKGSEEAAPADAPKGAAPDFRLPSTTGETVSLADFRGRNVLLYFSEGVGCDACFSQTVELEKNAAALRERGITLLPIVMNPVSETKSEMARFGIKTPYLIDADGSVTSAYGVLGTGMHANLPGHSFVFIDGSGRIRFEKEYPSMFVPTRELLDALPAGP